jgi:peptidoglycan/xylan/chitin deacetylase (PgdA/CDA1 family)
MPAFPRAWRLFVLLIALVLPSAAVHRLAAQAAGTGWIDVTVWQQQPDGSLAPLPSASVQLNDASGKKAVLVTTDGSGQARVEAQPAVYDLVVRSDGNDGSARLACGDSTWNAAIEKTPWGANAALTESTVELFAGRGLCRQYLFEQSAPPAAEAPQRNVYLTFDDGYVSLCLTVDLVARLGIHATFFLTGQAILTYPDCVRRLVANGNTLGNHTYAHEYLTRLSHDSIIRTLQATENAAQSVAGVSTKPFCRPPYGATNAAVRQAAADWGCRMVMWDRDTRDWAGVPAGTIVTQATSVGCNGEIVLMHTQGFPQDQLALPSIVRTLIDRGCTPAALGEG